MPQNIFLKRVAYYLPWLRRSIHVKLTLVNIVGRCMPEFFSGFILARLYRLAGFNIESDVFVMGILELKSNQPHFYEKLQLGSRTLISDHVTINLDAKVTVGEDVCIGPRVVIYTGGHRVGSMARRAGEVVARPVTIERGAWIRVGAIILPGVTIGQGSIVEAGAVVRHDVPPNSHVEGNPAHVVNLLR
jgi:maltose O-acetyltransferase